MLESAFLEKKHSELYRVQGSAQARESSNYERKTGILSFNAETLTAERDLENESKETALVEKELVQGLVFLEKKVIFLFPFGSWL